jgi:hypothetical protein
MDEELGLNSWQGQIYLFSTASRLGPGLFLCRPGDEVKQSPQFSAEVKNDGGAIPPPLQVFIPWCLIKCRDEFTFIFNSRTKCITN